MRPLPTGEGVRAALILSLALTALLTPALAGAPVLCLEYLPGIIYDDQPLSACARVEAAEATPVRLAMLLRDAKGRVLASGGGQGAPAADAPWRHTVSLRPGKGAPVALDVVLMKATGAGELGKVTVRVLDGRQALPPLRVKGMRLVDAAGQRVVVRIEHRIRERDQSWPLVRWVHHKLYGDRITFKHALLLGEDLGAPADGYLKRFGGQRPPFTMAVVAVASAPRPPGPPILRAVAALSRLPAKTRPDLAVLCLGHRDADFGTDVLQFHRGLELLLQQLERRGCTQAVIASPVGPSHLRKRLEPYADAARRVVATYGARHLDLGATLSDRHFTGGAADGRLLLRLPNPQGHAALADALTQAITRMRR